MASVSQNLLEFDVVCPYCGKREHIRVSREELERSPIGVLRVPIEHDSPEPHVLVLDIDPSGFVRGAYLIKKYADIRSLGGVSVFDVIKDIGVDNFARLLGWLLAGYNINIKDSKSRIAAGLRALLNLVFGEQKNTDLGLKLNPNKVKEPPFSIDILKRSIEYAINHMTDDRALITYIRDEIRRYRDAIRKILGALELKNEIDLKELKALLGDSMTDQEIRFLVAIITSVHPEYKRKINMPELRIADIL